MYIILKKGAYKIKAHSECPTPINTGSINLGWSTLNWTDKIFKEEGRIIYESLIVIEIFLFLGLYFI